MNENGEIDQLNRDSYSPSDMEWGYVNYSDDDSKWD
jgi:hypothetical protein